MRNEEFMSPKQKAESEMIKNAVDSGLGSMHFHFDPAIAYRKKRRKISMKQRVIILVSAAIAIIFSGFTIFTEVSDVSFSYLFRKIFGTESGEVLDSISKGANACEVRNNYSNGEISVGKLACDNKRAYFIITFERADGYSFSEKSEYNMTCSIVPEKTTAEVDCEMNISKGVVDKNNKNKISFVATVDYLADNGRSDIAADEITVYTGKINRTDSGADFDIIKGSSVISIMLPSSSKIITKRFSSADKSELFTFEGQCSALNISKAEVSCLTVYFYSDYADCHKIKNMPLTVVMKNGERIELKFRRTKDGVDYDSKKSFAIADFEQPVEVDEIACLIFNGKEIPVN